MQPEKETGVPQSVLQIVFRNRRGLRAGWRLLIFGAMISVVLLGLWYLQHLGRQAGPAAQAAPRGQLQFGLPIFQGIFLFVIFGLVLLISWVMSRIEHRNVGAYGLPLSHARPASRLIAGILLGFFMLLVTLALLRLLGAFYFGSIGLHSVQILIWGVLWGFGFLAVGFFEEYLFRGYALHTLADGIGFWPAAIILSFVFGRAHMGNGGETYIGIFGTVLFALFAAAMLRRTGSLWLPVGVHAGWDWGQSYFFGVSDSGFQAPGHLLNPRIQGPSWLSGGTVGPEGSIVTLIVLVLATVAVLVFYREQPAAPILIRVDAEDLAQPSP